MFTPAETTALTKAAADAAREGLTVGTHEVDVTVRVTGTVSVAEDTEKTPTVSIPVKEVLALFVARSGCTREASLALLRECLTDALSKGVSGTGAVEAAADIDEVFRAEVAALTSALPKTPVRGAVKAKLAVARVDVASVTALAAK